MITVLGYGSLLSERSARDSIRGLQNYRLVRVPGYKRVFNKVGIYFIYAYGVSPDDTRIASCATRPDPDHDIYAVAFECSEDEFMVLFEREYKLRWVGADYIEANGTTARARMCAEDTDENFRLNKCIRDDDYHRRVGQHYSGKIWRDDVLPFPTYLRHCLDAAASHGAHVLDNFLDSSFLADGTTSIRTYIQQNPGWDDAVRQYTNTDGK